jgi:hypothetical protein
MSEGDRILIETILKLEEKHSKFDDDAENGTSFDDHESSPKR